MAKKKPTTLSLAIKRVQFLVGAILVGVVAPQLIAGSDFSWEAIRLGSQVALGYWLLTTFRDWHDPNMPNR